MGVTDSGASEEMPPHIPARLLNEYAYCPRLFHLEWVESGFVDNADTVEGRFAHRNVDKGSGRLPAPEGDDLLDGRSVRSVMLSSDRLGAVAKMDLLECGGGAVVPVEYKRGTAPANEHRAWPPERAQVALQVMILRDNGYESDHGELLFHRSRERVRVDVDSALEEEVLRLLGAARDAARSPVPPPPLVDSPKCPRCSLVGICLPDETTLLSENSEVEEDERGTRSRTGGPRQVLVPEVTTWPVHVTAQGARLHKKGDELEVRLDDEVIQRVRLREISDIAVYGGVAVSHGVIGACAQRGITISHYSHSGWFRALTSGHSRGNVEVRIAQFRVADDTARSTELARSFVLGKVRNQRTMLRRNGGAGAKAALDSMASVAAKVREAQSIPTLLGLEGVAARLYFGAFSEMLRTDGQGVFEGRNKRPPQDPVNAVLSFAYALLVRRITVAAQVVGLDPYLGFYHRPRYGRPALALDIMEEFRPIIADSATINAFNNGELGDGSFVHAGPACSLTAKGRKAVIAAFERRMGHEITHPLFGYRACYDRIITVQLRLLARHLQGELAGYPPFEVR